jgi:hypothetical protein
MKPQAPPHRHNRLRARARRDHRFGVRAGSGPRRPRRNGDLEAALRRRGASPELTRASPVEQGDQTPRSSCSLHLMTNCPSTRAAYGIEAWDAVNPTGQPRTIPESPQALAVPAFLVDKLRNHLSEAPPSAFVFCTAVTLRRPTADCRVTEGLGRLPGRPRGRTVEPRRIAR